MSDIFVQLIDKYCSELLDPKGGAPWYPRTQIMEEINKLRQYAAKTDQQSEIDALHDEIEKLKMQCANLEVDDQETKMILRDNSNLRSDNATLRADAARWKGRYWWYVRSRYKATEGQYARLLVEADAAIRGEKP